MKMKNKRNITRNNKTIISNLEEQLFFNLKEQLKIDFENTNEDKFTIYLYYKLKNKLSVELRSNIKLIMIDFFNTHK